MRIYAVVIAAFAVTIAACGPTGNALGLEGTYGGSLVIATNGTVTVSNAGTDTDVRADTNTTKDAQLVIEPGYGADAIVAGVSGCPLSLKVDGEKLSLADAVECASDDESTFTVGTQDSSTTKKQTLNIDSLTIEKDGDNAIKLDGDGTFSEDETDASGKRTKGDLDMTLSFSGDRVGGA